MKKFEAGFKCCVLRWWVFDLCTSVQLERQPVLFLVPGLCKCAIIATFKGMNDITLSMGPGRILKVILFGLLIIPSLLMSQEQIEKKGSDALEGKEYVDTTRIKNLLDQFDDLRGSNPDSAILISRRAIELSDDVGYEVGKALGFKNIGNIYYDQGDLQAALDYFGRSLRVYEKESDTIGISNLQSNLGSVYADLGNNPEALDFYIKSLRNAQIVRDTLRMGTAHMNLGTVYQLDSITWPQAINNYQKAIEMFEAIDYKLGVAGSQLNFGEWYIDTGQPSEAIPYLEDALSTFGELGFYEAYPLNSLGEAYYKMGDYPKALEYLELARAEAEAKPNIGQETITFLTLGQVKSQLKVYSEAIQDFIKALELAEQTGVLEEQSEIYQGLSEAYAARSEYSMAYEAQKKYAEIQDALKDESYNREMSNLRVQFDLENAENEIKLLNTQNDLNELQIEKDARSKQLFQIIIGLFLAIIAGFVFQYFYIRRTNKRLAFERNRSEEILLNILPKETAEELKENGFIKAKEFEHITVLFTDFKAFSLVAERISAENLVKSVDYYFKTFDEITERHGLEKIKTIGDAYMCAGGIPTPNTTHVRDSFGAAREILKFVNDTELSPPPGIYPFRIRIGLNSGPVVAGVVGTKKFAYDIWGNTVNIAARMESGSVPGRINVSESIYEELKDEFPFTYRGELKVKGQAFKMYFADVPETILA
jgi:class 3 adenylate cyclase